ncbi:hypothetical protein INR49_004749 [Caranx melampygus]|nr:hypothetical protein INR49_004749 [Caranx melampygus]
MKKRLTDRVSGATITISNTHCTTSSADSSPWFWKHVCVNDCFTIRAFGMSELILRLTCAKYVQEESVGDVDHGAAQQTEDVHLTQTVQLVQVTSSRQTSRMRVLVATETAGSCTAVAIVDAETTTVRIPSRPMGVSGRSQAGIRAMLKKGRAPLHQPEVEAASAPGPSFISADGAGPLPGASDPNIKLRLLCHPPGGDDFQGCSSGPAVQEGELLLLHWATVDRGW